MYKSPIELLYNNMYDQIHRQIVKEQENAIYEAVVRCGVNVDKEELIRALKYDRQQYEAGYLEGKADAMESIVRCKDCRHVRGKEDGIIICDHPGLDWDVECYDLWLNRGPDDFCSQGERAEKYV